MTFRSAANLARVSVSPILSLSKQAAQLRAAGRDIIDMTIGEPDFQTPDHIQAAAIEAMRGGQTKYTALAGADALLDAIARKTGRDLGRTPSTAEIIGCAGAKQVISNALAATLDPGDEVVLPRPCWTSYGDMVRLQGGVDVAAAGRWDRARGWGFDPAAIEAAITPRTRWLILNSPSNPTGTVATKAELTAIAEVLRRHPQVWLLSDDIYEHIVFDGHKAPHMLTIAPDLSERTLLVNGVSKAYAMTGWRLGWGLGPAALIRAMTAVQSQLTSAPCSISQAAAAAALDGPQKTVTAMRDRFEQRRDLLARALQAIPGLSAPAPQGAFYYFPSVLGYIGARTTQGEALADDIAISGYLLDHAGVAVVPGSAFSAPGWLRMSFALSDEALAEAAKRLRQAFGALTSV